MQRAKRRAVELDQALTDYGDAFFGEQRSHYMTP